MNRLHILAIISFLCINASAQKEKTYDFESGGIYYKVNAENPSDVDVVKGDSLYKGSIVLPDSVSYDGKAYHVGAIAPNAFKHCHELTSIDLGSVGVIGTYAFNYCVALKSVDFAKVHTVDTGAFEDCSGLISVDLKNVLNMGSSAFFGCSSLTSVDMCKLTQVADLLFNMCSSLETVELRKVTSIGWSAFNGCSSLKSVDFKEVASIGEYAFCNCASLAEINLRNVAEISDGAFMYCSSLQTLDLKNVKKVGNGFYSDYDEMYCNGVFSECTALTSVDMGSAQNIGIYAFGGCTALKSVNMRNVNTIGNAAFSKCTALKDLKTLQNEAPEVAGDAFDTLSYAAATLTIPSGSLNSYSSHSVWSRFHNIEEDNAASVAAASLSSAAVIPVAGGISVSGVPRGILVSIFSPDGTLMAEHLSDGSVVTIPVRPGIAIVRAGQLSFKIAV